MFLITFFLTASSTPIGVHKRTPPQCPPGAVTLCKDRFGTCWKDVQKSCRVAISGNCNTVPYCPGDSAMVNNVPSIPFAQSAPLNQSSSKYRYSSSESIVEFSVIGLLCQTSSNPKGKGYYSDAEIVQSKNAFTVNFPATVKALSKGRINVVTKWIVLPSTSKCSYTFLENVFEMVNPSDIPGWEDAVYGVDWNSLTADEQNAKMQSPPFDTVFIFNPQPQSLGSYSQHDFAAPHRFSWISIGQFMYDSIPGDSHIAILVHEFLHTVVETLYQRRFGQKNPFVAKSLPMYTQSGTSDTSWVHAATGFGWNKDSMGIVDPDTHVIGSTVIPGTDIDIGTGWQMKAFPNSDAASKGFNGYYGLSDEILKLGNVRDYWSHNY